MLTKSISGQADEKNKTLREEKVDNEQQD